jgi:conjugal transfer mating pair stabilization protein TraG
MADPTVPQALSQIAANSWPPNAMPTPNQLAAPPGGAQGTLSPQDRDAMIKTIAGEAGGEPQLGQAGVAQVILNRVASGGYGNGVYGVVNQPTKPGSQYKQFSVWNPPGLPESSKVTHSLTPGSPQYAQIGDLVDKVSAGLIPDPTGGATHYYAPASMPGRRPPPWAAPLARVNDVTIGGTRFLGTGPEGPGYNPTIVANQGP